MNKKVTILALFSLCSLLLVPAAVADTACPTGAYGGTTNGGSGYGPNYNPQNLNVTTGSITCTTGVLSFSEFQWSGSPTTITPANVTVNPVTTPGDEGFQFQISGLGVSGSNSADSIIRYEVTAPAGTPITDLAINFNGSFGGVGTTDFTESYCTGGFTSGCQTFAVSNPSGPLDTTINISPTTTLFITKDVSVSCSAATNADLQAACKANVSTYGNTYSYVPEPGGVSWLAAGLVGLLFLGRKLRSSHAA